MGDLAAEKKTVVVTGFGPFATHKVNSSWVAVQELKNLDTGNDFDLVVEEIPVVYSTVKESIPNLWRKHKPKLVLHVGVSAITSKLTLEQQAHNDGYDKDDVAGSCPDDHTCVSETSSQCLVSGLNMAKVCDAINLSGCGIMADVSYDPGRYLCDYIYFTSLNIDHTCTAFIHVPPLGKPYTAVELARGIRRAIKAMLEQIS